MLYVNGKSFLIFRLRPLHSGRAIKKAPWLGVINSTPKLPSSYGDGNASESIKKGEIKRADGSWRLVCSLVGSWAPSICQARAEQARREKLEASFLCRLFDIEKKTCLRRAPTHSQQHALGGGEKNFLGVVEVCRLCRLKGKVNGCFGDRKDVFPACT